MNIAVTTDSSSGILAVEAEKMGVGFLPIPIIIDGETYYEGVNITPADVYAALESDKRITTSQPSPQSLKDLWDGLLDTGCETEYNIGCVPAAGRDALPCSLQ